MPNDKNPFEEEFQPDIKESNTKRGADGNKYKDKNVSDSKKIDKIPDEKPEKGSEGL